MGGGLEIDAMVWMLAALVAGEQKLDGLGARRMNFVSSAVSVALILSRLSRPRSAPESFYYT